MRRPAEATTLDGLLKELASPESCTSATVASAKALLAPGKAAAPRRSASAASRSRTYSRKSPAPSSTSVALLTVADRVDVALKVFKASLAALQQLKRAPKVLEKVTVNGSKKVSGPISAGHKTPAPKVTEPVDAISGVINEAIEDIGSANPNQQATRTMAMLYCNYMSQAVELDRAAHALTQWPTIHRLVNAVGKAVVKKTSLCFPRAIRDDQQWTEIVVTLQLSHLRARLAQHTAIDKVFSTRLLLAEGPIDTIVSRQEDQQRIEHLYKDVHERPKMILHYGDLTVRTTAARPR